MVMELVSAPVLLELANVGLRMRVTNYVSHYIPNLQDENDL